MFAERFEKILEILEIRTSSEFARYANCDRSYVSRLRTGDRTPKAKSRAAENLARSIYLCAERKGLTGELARLTESSDNADELCEAIEKFLLLDAQKPAERRRRVRDTDSGVLFSSKLNSVMELCDLSNVRLAQSANIDTSLVSRYRHGTRTPFSNEVIVNSLCKALISRVYYLKQIPGLCKLMNADPADFEDEERGELLFRQWLCVEEADTVNKIGRLISDINEFNPKIKRPLLTPEKAVSKTILNEADRIYKGNHGLRRAVLRLLGNALKNGAEELLLYSDQNMKWLTEDENFILRWSSLMFAIVKKGIRVRVIHNVNREMDELIVAIKSWMPFYMSGMIESYYSTKNSGERFFHTLFIAKGAGCVRGCGIIGREDDSDFFYETEKAEIDACEVEFNALSEFCLPLVRVGDESKNSFEPAGEICLDNITVSIGKKEIIVRRISEPIISFIISHPLLYNAFLFYYEQTEES